MSSPAFVSYSSEGSRLVRCSTYPEGYTQVRSAREDFERLGIVVAAVGGVGEGHAHTTKALGRDIVGADLALWVG